VADPSLRVGIVLLEFANGRTHRADLVVGADGVRSTVRRWITGADDARYSGTSALRGIVPTENLPSLPDPHAIQFWMGPTGTCCNYAIGGEGEGEAVNFFAVVEGPGSGCTTAAWPRSARRSQSRPSAAGIPPSPR
jgi:salicylate hydroxylase